ncbi:MAG: hypothetical protein OXU20_31620 [Myxococcales bacterium]|nr:hypothetical protein [Myxococcales bacterium]
MTRKSEGQLTEFDRVSRQVLALSGVITALLVGCGFTTRPQTDSRSNWLRACDEDADCSSELACVCGACTQACDLETECVGEGMELSCLRPEDFEGLGACASMESSPVPSACLLPCRSASDCGDGLVCEGGICIAEPEPAAPPIAVGGPDAGPQDREEPGTVPEVAASDQATAASVSEEVSGQAPNSPLGEEFSAWLGEWPPQPPPLPGEPELRIDGEPIPFFPPGLFDEETGRALADFDPYPYQFACLLDVDPGRGGPVRVYYAHAPGTMVEGLPAADCLEVCRGPYDLQGTMVSNGACPAASRPRCATTNVTRFVSGDVTREASFTFTPNAILLHVSVHGEGSEDLDYTTRIPLGACVGDLQAMRDWIAASDP